MTRLAVTKTYKLFIGGKYPRSESGRTLAVTGRDGEVLAHVARGSRKDLRDAVEAAGAARAKWAGATAYNRGQVLYRMAEMIEGRREDFASAIAATCPGGLRAARKEVDVSIDRLVCFGGWADKYIQVLGAQNPVAGPFYNFTAPEPTGLVAVVCPDAPALLGLVSLAAPPLCAGNAIIVVASAAHPLPAVLFAEACGTSDVPAGVVNVLTGQRDELLEPLSGHRQINAISGANLRSAAAEVLRRGVAENLKRVHLEKRSAARWQDPDVCESPWTIEPFVEMKTIWHPAGG